MINFMNYIQFYIFSLKQLNLKNGGQLNYYLTTNSEAPYTQSSTVNETPIKQQKINPNELKHYVSKEAVEELQASLPKIDTDLSKCTFYLWTPERGTEDPWEFKAGINPNELLAQNFDPNRPTKFIAHGWTDNGNHAKPFAEGK